MLVGYDGGPGSRDALAFARALCEATEAEPVVVSMRPYSAELLGDSFDLVIEEDERWVRRGAGRVLGAIPFSVRVLAGGGETAGLRELAKAEESDLIIVGSTRRGRLGRVCPGNVGERMLSEAPCAVAVAPRGFAGKRAPFGTIAVGYDGGRQSDLALATAIGLAERADASLQIIGVVEAGEGDQRARVRLHRRLEEAASVARRTVPAEVVVTHGVPGHVLPHLAEQADLLVIGSRGQFGDAHRVLLGSVAARVMRLAPCPALVTPAA
jgi:nucleotide-binding universal stress UspA family protein